jgi:hypothetical protein
MPGMTVRFYSHPEKQRGKKGERKGTPPPLHTQPAPSPAKRRARGERKACVTFRRQPAERRLPTCPQEAAWGRVALSSRGVVRFARGAYRRRGNLGRIAFCSPEASCEAGKLGGSRGRSARPGPAACETSRPATRVGCRSSPARPAAPPPGPSPRRALLLYQCIQLFDSPPQHSPIDPVALSSRGELSSMYKPPPTHPTHPSVSTSRRPPLLARPAPPQAALLQQRSILPDERGCQSATPRGWAVTVDRLGIQRLTDSEYNG